MASELDRKFDAVLAQVTGPGGRIQIAEDPQGRKIVANLPPTLPGLFDAFCMLHGATIAVIADGERLTFAELNAQANRLARALAGGWGVKKGGRVAIAMRNCPSWIVAYMAVLKAGGIATLVNGWWQSDELRHGLELTSPSLVLCDAPRAKRLEATGLGIPGVVLPVEKPIAEALAPLLGRGEADLPQVTPEDDATILFTSGSTGAAKGAVSTHRAVTTGIYSYSISLLALLGIMESEGHIAQAVVGTFPPEQGGTYNETHWDNEEHRNLVNAAARELDETKRAELLHQAQEIEYEEGGLIIWGFRQQVDGYAAGVQGLEPHKYLPLGAYRFDKVSV